MIGTKLLSGQGLGNQLWVYAVTRTIALRNGYEFAILDSQLFKGKGFLVLDYASTGKQLGDVREEDFPLRYHERVTRHVESGADISEWDKHLHTVKDGTFISGTMQSETYLDGFKEEVTRWFSTNAQYFDGCVISLRGGEYRNLREVFLPKSYYWRAIEKIRSLQPDVQFLVVTDDHKLSREYFPDFPVISSGGVKRVWKFYRHPKSEKIGRDFSSIQSARFLILSNSSFSWWGAYTNTFAEHVIAPKYWARFNVSDGYWSNGGSLTSGWDYLSKEGQFFSYEDCKSELELYRQNSLID